MLTAELHAHSSLSHDGRDEVELLLEQAEAVGLDALAVTDHDAIAASLEMCELAADVDVLGIPATEVTSEAGHVLALGVREAIPPGRSFAATAAAIHDAGGIVVVPHPFQSSRHGVLTAIDPEPVIEHADAIEVYNSRLLTGRSNRQADRFATHHGLPKTAGSDAHICEMVGQAVTHVETDEATVEAITTAIAEGRTVIEGRRTPWHISLRQAAGGARRRFRRRLPW